MLDRRFSRRMKQASRCLAHGSSSKEEKAGSASVRAPKVKDKTCSINIKLNLSGVGVRLP